MLETESKGLPPSARLRNV